MRVTGLSLIELLAALAIAGTLTGYALFWSAEWVAEKRANATVNSFAAAVHIARQSAIMDNVTVTLCPMAADGCGPRNTWHAGATIFVDHDRDRRIDGRDHVIKTFANFTDGTRVYWRSFRNRSFLRFTGNGLTDWQNGNFLFCPEDNDPRHARQLILNTAGRMYFSKDSNADGIHEDASGRPLACP